MDWRARDNKFNSSILDKMQTLCGCLTECELGVLVLQCGGFGLLDHAVRRICSNDLEDIGESGRNDTMITIEVKTKRPGT